MPLGYSEDQENGNHDKHVASHDNMPASPGALFSQEGNAEGESSNGFIRGHHQGPKVIIPMVDNAKKPKSHNRRLGYRGHNTKDKLKNIGSIDARRIQNIITNPQKGLSNEKGTQSTDSIRKDQSGIGINQPNLTQQDKKRDKTHLRRHNEASDDQIKTEVSSPKCHFGKRIGRQAG